DSTIAGTFQFLDPGNSTSSGQPINVTIGGATNTIFSYSIPGRSSQKFVTSGSGSALRSGSVHITPATGQVTPSVLTIFSFKTADSVTVAQAAVPAVRGSALDVYVESNGAPGSMGSIQSG